MIKLTDNLWIGNSTDGLGIKVLGNSGILRGVLNVAQDLYGECGWPGVEYMQVGLIDGPGNPLAAYYAAILALDTLTTRHQQVLVYCHTGSRSMAVVLMYLNATGDYWREWDDWFQVLRERVDIDLPVPHEAHRLAFGKIHWGRLTKLVGSGDE